MRHLGAVLALVLVLGPPWAASVEAADASSERTLADPVSLSLDLDVMASQAVQQSTAIGFEQAVSYVKLDAAKATMRELGRQYRRDRRGIRTNVPGPLRQCHLDKIAEAYQQERARLQAEIDSHRRDLGYVNRQKGFTKLGARLSQFARFTGEIIKEAGISTRPQLGQLLEAVILGGGGGTALKSALKQGFGLFKKRVVEVFKRRLQDETLARVTGARPSTPLDQAAAECEALAGAVVAGESADEPEESYDTRLDTGPFRVRDVYGYSPAHGRQAGAIMSWADIAGDACADFEAYNPEPMDPRNEKLPGTTVNLVIDPGKGSFVGVLSGRTEADDLSTGGKATGTFRVVMRGTITTADPSSGWTLRGETATASLTYDAVRACWNPNDLTERVEPRVVSRSATLASVSGMQRPGSLHVDGQIRPGASDWELDLELTGSGGGQEFSLWLTNIKLGPVIVDRTATDEPTAADAATTSPQPIISPEAASPKLANAGSDLPPPWGE